jgi:hypothetical protein
MGKKQKSGFIPQKGKPQVGKFREQQAPQKVPPPPQPERHPPKLPTGNQRGR